MCNFVSQLLEVTTDNASNNNTFIHSWIIGQKNMKFLFVKQKTISDVLHMLLI